MNLIALSALTALPTDEAPASPKGSVGAVENPIPILPNLDALAPDARNLVLALSELGANPNDRIIPSLYRHLAYWPGFLALTWSMIAPMHADGRLRGLMDRGWEAGHQHAGRIVGEIDLGPAPDTADQARAAIEEFKRTAISRMVPIGMIIRRMMG